MPHIVEHIGVSIGMLMVCTSAPKPFNLPSRKSETGGFSSALLSNSSALRVDTLSSDTDHASALSFTAAGSEMSQSYDEIDESSPDAVTSSRPPLKFSSPS